MDILYLKNIYILLEGNEETRGIPRYYKEQLCLLKKTWSQMCPNKKNAPSLKWEEGDAHRVNGPFKKGERGISQFQ